MKLSPNEELFALREKYLEREADFYRTLLYGKFEKVKDWDDKGPLTIWEGTLEHSSLSRTYKVQIRYPWQYPYRRPQIYPVEPRIIHQRHQMPNWDNERSPGALCYMPYTPDYWQVGMTCHEIVERAIKWFRHYENGTLGDEFAPPEIEIYFPPSYHETEPKVLAISSLLFPGEAKSGSCLLFSTDSGKFAFFATLIDEQSTEEKTSEVYRLNNLILPDEKIASGMLTGNWYRLKEEPQFPVPLNSAALTNLLVKNGISEREIYVLAKQNPQIIALCYPTAVDELHWLLFKTKLSSPSRDGFRKQHYSLKFRQANTIHPLKLYSLNHINPQTIFRRVDGFAVETMLTKKCLLLGCGSLGSVVAEELIKSGIGNLTIIDNDTLKTGNVCRHRLGLNYLGQNKAEAIKLELLRKNPFAKIQTLALDPLNIPNGFQREVENSDLIISCFGNDSTELFINQICRRAKKTALYCRSHLEGRLGEIFLAREGAENACFSCAADYLGAKECPIPRPPEILYDKLVKFDGDCGTAFIPASSVDLGIISLHCVRSALSFLQNKDENHNYWLIRGREFDGNEYSELQGDVRQPFTNHSYIIPLSKTCQYNSK